MSFRTPVAVAAIAATILAASASAGLAERFIVSSTLMTNPPQTAGNAGDVYGLLAADVDTATWGYVRTSMTTADFSISMGSAMSVYNNQFIGKSQCLATYAIDGTSPIQVDWNWSSLTKTGGWRVMNEAGSTVAELSFNAGVFTSIGGTWAQQSTGLDFINLAAGSYTFEAFYEADQMPASSLVNWNLGAVPAPGCLALLGIAGLARSRRQR